jgi:hypothetical protein
MAELLYWRKGDRVAVGLVKNPARQGKIDGPAAVHGVTGKPIDVEIVFRAAPAAIRNLRTGKALPAGRTITAKWKPWEALLFEIVAPRTKAAARPATMPAASE